jgi:hypothetical protein
LHYNTDIRELEIYSSAASGWSAQDPTANFGGHNLVTYSEQFDNAAWTKTNISIVANSVRAPDGTLTADTWVENTASGAQHAVNLASTVSASPNTYYTFSIYAKSAGRTKLSINFSDINFAGNVWSIDLSALTIVQGGAGWTAGTMAATITNVGNDWRRITITGQTTGSVSQVGPYMYLADNSGATSYTGDGTSGAYFWGAQVERSNTAGPYVRTTTILSPVPTVLNGYRTHTYTTTGTSGFTAATSGTVEVLIVAGGGGGANATGSNWGAGGGGGAGGLIYNMSYPVVAGQQYTVSVGAGGAGGVQGVTGAGGNGANGGNSSFGRLTAIGGGGAGTAQEIGLSGGSGGGSGYNNLLPGAGTAGQGFTGGRGQVTPSSGGGGGAGGPGADGNTNIPGYGGNGRQISISGVPTYYAGGGGGGYYNANLSAATGGLGGGGAGGTPSTSVSNAGSAATANTGGGGGGGSSAGSLGSGGAGAGGAGGSGIVIVRYRYS